MSEFELRVERVHCRPEQDLCRTVRYAAEQFGLRLQRLACATGDLPFEAILVGRRLSIERLVDVVRASFPEAAISVAEVAPEAAGKVDVAEVVRPR